MISFLQYFGVTPDKYPFLVLGILLVSVDLLIYTRIDKRVINIDSTLDKIKLNIKAVVTFLATDRPRFDPGLIEAMSPLQIKDKGYEILEESGFKTIMEKTGNRSLILRCISDQQPATKLDVEKYSIVFFNSLLENDFMNPIKTYLYDHPDHREVFPTLAGIYIRDEYLKDHPEIVA